MEDGKRLAEQYSVVRVLWRRILVTLCDICDGGLVMRGGDVTVYSIVKSVNLTGDDVVKVLQGGKLRRCSGLLHDGTRILPRGRRAQKGKGRLPRQPRSSTPSTAGGEGHCRHARFIGLGTVII